MIAILERDTALAVLAVLMSPYWRGWYQPKDEPTPCHILFSKENELKTAQRGEGKDEEREEEDTSVIPDTQLCEKKGTRRRRKRKVGSAKLEPQIDGGSTDQLVRGNNSSALTGSTAIQIHATSVPVSASSSKEHGCFECKKRFATAASLLQHHRTTRHGFCPHCWEASAGVSLAMGSSSSELPFSSASALKAHVKENHPGTLAVLVDTLEALSSCISTLLRCQILAVDLEAVCHVQRYHGAVSLLQFATDLADTPLYVIDVLSLMATPEKAERLKESLGQVLGSKSIAKVIFDCRNDVEALFCQLQVRSENVIDLQLYVTYIQWCDHRSQTRHSLRSALSHYLYLTEMRTRFQDVKSRMAGGEAVWEARPLTSRLLDYACSDVYHLHSLYKCLLKKHPALLQPVQKLTQKFAELYMQEETPRIVDPTPIRIVQPKWMRECLDPEVAEEVVSYRHTKSRQKYRR